jgi:hypothetical protein
MKKPENPLFFLLALWLICIALVAVLWWALAAFLARYRG